MNLPKLIADLKAYNAYIEQAILNLELAASTGTKRRGRPPAWMKKTQAAALALTGRQRKPANVRLESEDGNA